MSNRNFFILRRQGAPKERALLLFSSYFLSLIALAFFLSLSIPSASALTFNSNPSSGVVINPFGGIRAGSGTNYYNNTYNVTVVNGSSFNISYQAVMLSTAVFNSTFNNSYVPYNGSTQNVDLGGYSLNASVINGTVISALGTSSYITTDGEVYATEFGSNAPTFAPMMQWINIGTYWRMYNNWKTLNGETNISLYGGGWFNGLFNITTDKYFYFDGWNMTMNETILNSSIDSRISTTSFSTFNISYDALILSTDVFNATYNSSYQSLILSTAAFNNTANVSLDALILSTDVFNSTFNSTYAAGIPFWYNMTTTSLTLNQISNPTADKLFAMTTHQLSFLWTTPATADGALELEANGAFSGDLLHVHQHTGNPGTTDLVHLEASDADVAGMNITTTGIPLWINGINAITFLYNQTDWAYNKSMNNASYLATNNVSLDSLIASTSIFNITYNSSYHNLLISTAVFNTTYNATYHAYNTSTGLKGNYLMTTGDNVTGFLNASKGIAANDINVTGTIWVGGTNLSAGGSGGGAKAIYIPLLNHFTALEEITATAGQWQTGAAASATYGRTGHYINFSKLGTPTMVELQILYTYSAAAATANNVSITVNAAPDDGGTQMTPLVPTGSGYDNWTMTSTTAYPLTKFLHYDPASMTDGWYQLVYQLASANIGPDLFSADLVLYYT